MSDTRLNPKGEDPGTPLPLPLSTVLRDPVEEAAVYRMWRRIEERRLRPRPRARTIVGWASAGAALAVVVMSLLLLVAGERGGQPLRAPVAGPLVLRDGSPVPEVSVVRGAPAAALDLSDGSRVVVDPGARLEPLVSSGREFIVRLGSGRTSFSVEPGGPRRWVVEAGLVSVEVVGTRFEVIRRPDSVRVEVGRGQVLVRGPGVPDGVVRLGAGESIDVTAPPAEAASVPAIATQPTPSRPQRVEAWRTSAARGDYRDAYVVLGADGLRRETARARSADELFTLADVARLSGHPADAVASLEGIVANHASSPRAALAAVTLGRIELDLGRPRRASQAFERALALGAPAGLVEDVHARLVESHARAGDLTGARAAAREYERRFPQGRRKADVLRWASP